MTLSGVCKVHEVKSTSAAIAIKKIDQLHFFIFCEENGKILRLPAKVLSRLATLAIAMTTEFEVLSHQAGTNVVNHTRLATNANNPSTRP